jgi:hypothetical protein
MFGFLPSPLIRKRPLAAALKLGTPVNPSSKQAKSDYRVRGTSIPCSKRAISDCSVRGTSIPYSKKAISDYGVRNAAISRSGTYHRRNVRYYGENKIKKNRPEIADGPLVPGYTFARVGGSGLGLSTTDMKSCSFELIIRE